MSESRGPQNENPTPGKLTIGGATIDLKAPAAAIDKKVEDTAAEKIRKLTEFRALIEKIPAEDRTASTLQIALQDEYRKTLPPNTVISAASTNAMAQWVKERYGYDYLKTGYTAEPDSALQEIIVTINKLTPKDVKQDGPLTLPEKLQLPDSKTTIKALKGIIVDPEAVATALKEQTVKFLKDLASNLPQKDGKIDLDKIEATKDADAKNKLKTMAAEYKAIQFMQNIFETTLTPIPTIINFFTMIDSQYNELYKDKTIETSIDRWNNFVNSTQETLAKSSVLKNPKDYKDHHALNLITTLPLQLAKLYKDIQEHQKSPDKKQYVPEELRKFYETKKELDLLAETPEVGLPQLAKACDKALNVLRDRLQSKLNEAKLGKSFQLQEYPLSVKCIGYFSDDVRPLWTVANDNTTISDICRNNNVLIRTIEKIWAIKEKLFLHAKPDELLKSFSTEYQQEKKNIGDPNNRASTNSMFASAEPGDVFVREVDAVLNTPEVQKLIKPEPAATAAATAKK